MEDEICTYPGCTRTDTSPVWDYSVNPPQTTPLCPEHAGPQAEDD